LQIWKYRSHPETIRICLKICGLWGSAYHRPGDVREGTIKSRAPSGVVLISSGVSTSRNSCSQKKLRVTCIAR
jgi:hypothetical protein